jgi:tRNA dimethylallyltransferase
MPESKVDHKIPLVVIAGPTAVGKSELGLQVARQLGTEIISADSAQVYRYMDIGTAKPTKEEQRQVKHHLIDLVDPDQPFSVADYQQAANDLIKNMWSAGKLPLMVGGTGLYIRAVTTAYAFGRQGADHKTRESYEQEASKYGLSFLYDKLQHLDPEAARKIHPNDQKRIIRALEVYSLEGKPISEQVTKTVMTDPPFNTAIFGLNLDRVVLYERIEERVEKMLEAGFLGEVQNLKDKGFGKADPGLQILGYRQIFSYLENNSGWEDTVADIKKETRNLAKRQITWFRREKEITWFDLDKNVAAEDITENICKIVKDLVP